MQLRLTAVASPQTQNTVFRTVGHVDKSLVPPSFQNGPGHVAQDQPIVSHLHKTHSIERVGESSRYKALGRIVAAGRCFVRCQRTRVRNRFVRVRHDVQGESLPMRLPRCKRFQVNVVAGQSIQALQKRMNLFRVDDADVTLAQQSTNFQSNRLHRYAQHQHVSSHVVQQTRQKSIFFVFQSFALMFLKRAISAPINASRTLIK